MTTINLQQNKHNDQAGFTVRNANKGFIFSLGILVFTLLVLAGLKTYVPYAEDKNKALTDYVAAENNKLVGLKSLEQVVDMQRRLSEIKSNLKLDNGNVTRPEMTKILDHLASDMNTSAVVSNFKYDGSSVTVSFDANNFSDIAKQILDFKKSDFFTNVDVMGISRKENAIDCIVEMKIKQ